MNENQISQLLGDLSKFSSMAQASHENKDHSKAHERIKKVLDLAQLAIAGYAEYLKIKGMKNE